MDTQFWMGVVSTIVLGLVVNLMTPPVATFIAERSAQFRQRRVERIIARYNRVKTFATDRAEYQLFLMQTLLRVVAFAALGGLVYFYAGASSQLMAWLFGATARHPMLLESMASFQATTTLMAFVMCLGTVLLCKTALEVDKQVRDFPAYEEEVLKRLGEEHRALLRPDVTV